MRCLTTWVRTGSMNTNFYLAVHLQFGKSWVVQYIPRDGIKSISEKHYSQLLYAAKKFVYPVYPRLCSVPRVIKFTFQFYFTTVFLYTGVDRPGSQAGPLTECDEFVCFKGAW